MGVLAYVTFALDRSADEVQTEQQVAETSQTLGAVADPLARLCAEDPTVRQRVGAACDTASQALTTLAERGATGQTGAQGVAGVAGAAGKPGTPGAPGTAGTNGLDGQDGADGQSPPCLSEPGMCQGRDGTDGTAGAPGAPPVGWTTTFPDGSSQVCRRVENFDPEAPQYTCTASAPQTPETNTQPEMGTN